MLEGPWWCSVCRGICLDLMHREETQRDMLARLNAWERHYDLPLTTIEVFERYAWRSPPAKVRRVRRGRRRRAGEATT